jgi:hypothetical protein
MSQPDITPEPASGPVVGIHLDLKYLMPRKTYLNEWVRALPGRGINTLLLEYEDKFPFRKHPYLTGEDAFTPDELRAFLGAARGAGLRVVPLVQTLSHLEFALAHPQLAAFREAPDIPTQICPSNPEAVRFVRDLLDEVLAFHKADNWVHLGADEAWSLGVCQACAAEVARVGKTVLWAGHVRAMCAHAQAHGKRPLVWDDAFWKEPAGEHALPPEAIFCAWHYGDTARLPDSALERCAAHYGRVGRPFLGIPCANWGVLLPRRRHTLDNTAVVAETVREHGGLGVINSAWACFHVPLPALGLQLEATVAAMRGCALTTEWEADALEREFGVRIAGLSDALEAFGKLWEVRVEGIGRPLTPMVHGMMDMVLHYPGGQPERMRTGAYPPDWSRIDFRALHRRKIEHLRALPAGHAFWHELRQRLDDYARAMPALEQLAAQATAHRSEAAALAALARMKRLAARALACRLEPERTDASLAAELVEGRAALRDALAAFYEPAGLTRFVDLIVDPVLAELHQTAVT